MTAEAKKQERSQQEKQFIASLLPSDLDLRTSETATQPQNSQPKHKTSFTFGNGKYMMGAALLVVAGLLAYKYLSTPSQDEDEEDIERQKDNVNPGNLNHAK